MFCLNPTPQKDYCSLCYYTTLLHYTTSCTCTLVGYYYYNPMLVISVLAAICSTTASIPQLRGQTKKLSNVSMVLRCSGACLWIIYGLTTAEIQHALVVSSAVAGLVEIILFIKTNNVVDSSAKSVPKEGAVVSPCDLTSMQQHVV